MTRCPLTTALFLLLLKIELSDAYTITFLLSRTRPQTGERCLCSNDGPRYQRQKQYGRFSGARKIFLSTKGTTFLQSRRMESSEELLDDANSDDNMQLKAQTEEVQELEQIEFSDELFGKALSNMGMLMNPSYIEAYPPSIQGAMEQCTKSVYVQESSIPDAGLGLFASQDIPMGTLISFYPVDALGINFRDGGSTWYMSPDTYNDDEGDSDHSAYALLLLGDRPLLGWDPQGQKIFIDYNPRHKRQEQHEDETCLIPSSAWQAHYINDAYLISENSAQSVERYYKRTREEQSVAILPFGPAPLCAGITTRDVKKGEEFFTTYGYSYWMAMFSQNPSDWVERTPAVWEQEHLLMESYLEAKRSLEENYNELSEDLHELFELLY